MKSTRKPYMEIDHQQNLSSSQKMRRDGKIGSMKAHFGYMVLSTCLPELHSMLPKQLDPTTYRELLDSAFPMLAQLLIDGTSLKELKLVKF